MYIIKHFYFFCVLMFIFGNWGCLEDVQMGWYNISYGSSYTWVSYYVGVKIDYHIALCYRQFMLQSKSYRLDCEVF